MGELVLANGWLDNVGDQDWFKVSLVAGQRYYVELLGGALGDQRTVVNTRLPGGGEAVQGWWMTGDAFASPAYAFVAPVSGTYAIQVLPSPTQVGLDPVPPVPYALRVSAIAADPQSDLAATATLLTRGTPVAAQFDLPGDVDAYGVDLVAGQRVVFEASSAAGANLSLRASLLGPGGATTRIEPFDSTTSQLEFVFTAPATGRYTLNLTQRDADGTAAAPGAAAYTVRVATAAADDRPDQVSTALPIGSTLAGALDLPGDIDSYAVTLAASKRYEFDLRALDLSFTDGVQLRLYDAAGTLVHIASRAQDRYASMSFEPQSSGSYTLRVDAPAALSATTLGLGGYTIGARQLPADDFTSRFDAATEITFDNPVTLRFDSSSDVDVFRFSASSLGQRYVATLTSSTSGFANATVAVVPNAVALQSLLNVSEPDAQFAGIGFAGAEHDGAMYVAITPRPGFFDPAASWTLTLSVMPRDDHADVPTQGTLLRPDAPVGGLIDAVYDVDWFRADLLAGSRYLFEVLAPLAAREAGVLPSLALFDASGHDPMAGATGSVQPQSSFVFTPASSGTYYLRPGEVQDYAVLMRELPADDHPDTPVGATPLAVAPVYLPGGLMVQGGAAAESLVGSAAADDLSGGDGDDRFFGAAGDDRLDGGHGLDTARYAGHRADYAVTRTDDTWRVADALGRDGADHLTTIERLVFEGDGQALALDVHGNAGFVAKLIGALFGKAYLQPALVGIGLGLVDEGLAAWDLVSLALGSALFQQLAGGTGNEAFVQLVFSNVVGRAPSAQELAYWTGQLDGGAFTQASLAIEALHTEANAVNIDLVGLMDNGLPYTPI